jgi:hypothetical protein
MNEARRKHEVMVRLNDAELTCLDEHRGGLSRAGYVRSLLREPPTDKGIVDRQEVLALLSEQARAGKVAAAVALVRALKHEDGPTIDDALDRILGEE